MESQTIAVLMTCHNRREKTLGSLAALLSQELPIQVKLAVYLVDDASTDNTAEAVKQSYPEIQIIPGNGSLFWNGGMRRAFTEAISSDPDFYLWLNDDTVLYPTALSKLISTYEGLEEQAQSTGIIVGSTRDEKTGNLTYGGMVRKTWWHPLKFCLLEPTKQAQPCQTMNGNSVLIPRAIAQVVGNLDPNFVHSIGDMDYGLRVLQHGYSVWLAPGYVGTCSTHLVQDDFWENQDLTWHQRLKKVRGSKGLPIREWKVFTQRHAGPLWPIYWGLPYARLLLAALFGGKMGSQINT